MKLLPWLLLAVLAAVFGYGFFTERLYAQQMWTDGGGTRFLLFAAVYWAAAGLIVWLAPRWLLWIAGGFVLLYTAWFEGSVLAPLAVLYFLGSCFCLGSVLVRAANWLTATLTGAAAWMLAIWVALHFPINRPWLYLLLLGLPYVAHAILRAASRIFSTPPPTNRPTAAAQAVLLFVLLAHWLVALKPEISADGLSMHLALPAAVAEQSRWTFDFLRATWALMPAGADCLYTAVYLLRGEAAVRLLNAAFLALIAAGVAQAACRWVSPSMAALAAALFASTPLVQLVTGSLFVENVWAAFVLGSALALLDYFDHRRPRDLMVVALLAGAALAVKLIAAAFALPLLLLAGIAALRDKQWRPAQAAAAVFTIFAAPPYLYAWARSGNPVYPFLNAVFRSPYYDASVNFTDERYAVVHPSWTAPYDLTFRSATFIEGQNGAAGFQYWLLLLPAAVLARRREQAALLAIAATAGIIVFAETTNLRYLYAALPLASIAIAWLAAAAPRAASAAFVAVIGVNLWFLPSSGWYDTDFAYFRPSQSQAYLERMAPVRLLIAELNRVAPGEPVAFFSTDATAGLRGTAYTDTWHSEPYWKRVQEAPDAAVIAGLLAERKVRYVVAPVTRWADFEVVGAFLERWLDPGGSKVGPLAIYRLRAEPIPKLRDTRPFQPGRYDDREARIEYSGAWLHDLQFAEAWDHSLTYSNVAGDSARFTFRGTGITYFYTKAANRGVAEVWIDGRLRQRLNLRSEATEWQASTEFTQLAEGEHTFELRVGGDGYTDLDGFEVR